MEIFNCFFCGVLVGLSHLFLSLLGLSISPIILRNCILDFVLEQYLSMIILCEFDFSQLSWMPCLVAIVLHI